MSNVHKYDYEIDMEQQSAGAYVSRFVGENKKVLELGAGPGAITKLLSKNNCIVSAIEIDEDAIELLKPYCDKVYSCNLNEESWTSMFSKEGKFEVIVAADVLEHLYDPWSTLEGMRQLLDDEGYVVISLPHIGHNAIVSCLLNDDFHYNECGLLDKTHLRFFAIKNIQQLFAQTGFKIVEAKFVVISPDETEFKEQWNSTPKAIKDSLKMNKFGEVYQVIVKATPLNSSAKALELMNMKVPMSLSERVSKKSLVHRLAYKVQLKIYPYLSIKSRTKFASLLMTFGIRNE